MSAEDSFENTLRATMVWQEVRKFIVARNLMPEYFPSLELMAAIIEGLEQADEMADIMRISEESR
jgi:hypothetical protein